MQNIEVSNVLNYVTLENETHYCLDIGRAVPTLRHGITTSPTTYAVLIRYQIQSQLAMSVLIDDVIDGCV